MEDARYRMGSRYLPEWSALERELLDSGRCSSRRSAHEAIAERYGVSRGVVYKWLTPRVHQKIRVASRDYSRSHPKPKERARDDMRRYRERLRARAAGEI